MSTEKDKSLEDLIWEEYSQAIYGNEELPEGPAKPEGPALWLLYAAAGSLVLFLVMSVLMWKSESRVLMLVAMAVHAVLDGMILYDRGRGWNYDPVQNGLRLAMIPAVIGLFFFKNFVWVLAAMMDTSMIALIRAAIRKQGF